MWCENSPKGNKQDNNVMDRQGLAWALVIHGNGPYTFGGTLPKQIFVANPSVFQKMREKLLLDGKLFYVCEAKFTPGS